MTESFSLQTMLCVSALYTQELPIMHSVRQGKRMQCKTARNKIQNWLKKEWRLQFFITKDNGIAKTCAQRLFKFASTTSQVRCQIAT